MTTEFNQKVKQCWCDKCKKQFPALVPPMPYCPDCKGSTVIAMFDSMTGERITGNGKPHWLDALTNPLSPRSRQSGDSTRTATDDKDEGVNGRRF